MNKELIMEQAIENLNDIISEFIGFNYRFNIRDMGIGIEIIQENDNFHIPYIINNYHKIINIVNKELASFLSDIDCDPYSMQYLIDKIAFKLVFDIDDSYNMIKIQQFIRTLQNISNMTYENENVSMSMFYCKTKSDVVKFKESNEYEYIDVQCMNIKDFILSQKPLLKLIDNENYSMVIDNKFNVQGIIKRQYKSRPISTIMDRNRESREKELFLMDLLQELIYIINTYYKGNIFENIIKCEDNKTIYMEYFTETEYKKINDLLNEASEFIENTLKEQIRKISQTKKDLILDENILYITIQNKEIDFYINDCFSLSNKNGNWKINNYVNLAHNVFWHHNLGPWDTVYKEINIIYTDIIKNQKFASKDRQEIKKLISKKLKCFISISDDIFKLLYNIRFLSKENIGALFVIISQNIYEDKGEKLIEKNMINETYKCVLNGRAHINKMNDSDIQLIASIDGATILNEYLEIISFTEMIKSQDVNTSYCEKGYGARTNAAINAASVGGMSIKISEDGDISVYRPIKYKGECNEIIERVEKVLTL